MHFISYVIHSLIHFLINVYGKMLEIEIKIVMSGSHSIMEVRVEILWLTFCIFNLKHKVSACHLWK